MKIKIIARRFAALVPALLLLLPLSASAIDVHVPGDVSSLAEALQYAGRDDRVIIAPGQYHVRDVALVEGVTVVGDPGDPGAVVLNAQGLGRVLRAENLEEVTLIGLTLTGGRADGAIGYHQSGGALLVSNSRVILQHVHVVDNTAVSDGGGVQVLWGDLQASDCLFADNGAAGGGGAVDLRSDSRGKFARCRFEDNVGAWGGGVSSRAGSRCWFNDSSFLGNDAVAPQEIGGAFFADYSAVISFVRSVLAGNAARQGGAVRLADAASTFTNCTVVQNSAWESGGAIMVRGGSLILDRSIVAFNDGASVTGEIAQLYVGATDIYGNADGDWVGEIAGLADQNDNLSADPLFCSLDDFRLQGDSPCAPDGHPRGLIGALPVGCDHAAIELRDFSARIDYHQITLTWEVVAEEPHEYRLRGHFLDGPAIPAWDVPYQEAGEPGSYVAVDKPDLDGGVVVYRLEARRGGADWFELGEVQANPATTIPQDALTVGKVYPNPFNPRVTIQFTLQAATRVQAVVYDLQGRLVRTLVSDRLEAGRHELVWDSRDDRGRLQPTGTYLLRLGDEQRQQTTKLLLMK